MTPGSEALRRLRRGSGFGAPAVALLTVLFVCLGVGATLVTPSLGDGVAVSPALQLEAIEPGITGVQWSDRARMPAAARDAGVARLVSLTVAVVGLTAVVAFLGLVGLWHEESVRRRPEGRIRRAVGATRRRLVWECLEEAAVLAAAAAAFGVLVTALARMAIGATWPGTLQASLVEALPIAAATILAGAAVATVVRALAFSAGVARSGAFGGDRSLADAAPGPSAHPLLSLAQIAAVVAVLTTGLWMLAAITASVGPGTAAGTVSEAAETPTSAPPGPTGEFHRLELGPGASLADVESRDPDALADVLSGLREHPDVEVAAFASIGATLGLGIVDHVLTDCGRCSAGGIPMPMKGEAAVHHLATSDTFAALGIPLVAGRSFRPSDDDAAEPVALVSRGFARRNFENGNPLGRRMKVGATLDRWYTVVGVVEDATRWAIGAPEQPAADVYLAATQHAPIGGELFVSGSLGEREVTGLLRGTGWEVGASAPLRDYRSEHARPLQWFGGLWLGWSALAFGIALFGVFSTMRLKVRGETVEIGIRRAVGARRRHILRHYVGKSLRLGAAGAALGAWTSLFALPHLPGLDGVGIGSMAALAAGVGIALVAAALVGSILPAWRGARTMPHRAMGSGS